MINKCKIKNNQAITLVALIITVIILIILAGVSLNLALGQNGIFQKSKEAVDKYQNAAKEEKEQLDLAARDLMLDDYVQDGLMLHYDAVKNTKNGHDKSSTTWYDLSGNNNNGTLNGNVTWTEDGLYFDGTDDWVSIGKMNYDNITIEAVIMHNRKEQLEECIIGNWDGGGYGIVSNNYINDFDVFTKQYNYSNNKRNFQVEKKYSLSGSYDNHKVVFYENNNKTTTEVEGTIQSTKTNTVMALGTNPHVNLAQGSYFKRHNIFRQNIQQGTNR